MKTNLNRSLGLLFLGLSLIATACGPSATPTPVFMQTWIDAPLHGDNLEELPYWVTFHGASFFGLSEFELSVNGIVEGTTPPESTGSGGPEFGTMFFGKYLWSPPAPGTYLLGVRPMDGDGGYGPLVEVEVTVGEQLVGLVSPIPIGPTSTPALKACTYTALQNVFCRVGPGREYGDVDDFEAGQSAEVIGFSAAGFHAYVLGPRTGALCAVPSVDPWGETEGDCNNIPLFTPPPLPFTPTPTIQIGVTPRLLFPTPTFTPIPPPS